MEKELIFCLQSDYIKLLSENGYIHLLKDKVPGEILYKSPFYIDKNLVILDMDLINIRLLEIYKSYGLGVRKMEEYFFLKETKEGMELVNLSKSSISRLEKKYSDFDFKDHYKELEKIRNSYNAMNMFTNVFNSEFQEFELKEFSQPLNSILSNYILDQNKKYIIENLKNKKIDLKYQKMYKYKYSDLIYELVKKPSIKRFLRAFEGISSIKKSNIKLLEQIQKSIIFTNTENTDFKYNYMLSEIYKIAIIEDVKDFENSFYIQYLQGEKQKTIEMLKKRLKTIKD